MIQVCFVRALRCAISPTYVSASASASARVIPLSDGVVG